LVEKVDLQRYEITGRLGAGADYDVRAAIDRETGAEVALKRPVPQAVSRKQHGAIEARTERLLGAYDHAGDAGGLLAPLLGYCETAVYDEFFGEKLGEPYTVFVQGRAPGIPLLGDMMSRFTGVPIGAGQNLFAMFPLIQAKDAPPFPVHSQLLDLEQSYLESGFILMDLRPQNVFYQPGSGRIQVIDTGALAGVDDPAPRGRPPLDVNDACLELLKFYTTPEEPPQNSSGYRDARGVRPIVNIQQELMEIRRGLLGAGDGVAATAEAILGKIEARSYEDYEQFRRDLSAFLEAVSVRNRSLPDYVAAQSAWREALDWLRADYWTRFRFDAETELAAYGE
jgi:serine/threonine protein kinase